MEGRPHRPGCVAFRVTSIKTRIETQRTRSAWSAMPAFRVTSIKTRIET